ncbi:UNKNOWN [Stylonychia lemnae]|uniref:Uncharacterized protein n=1 Tax=Stylonychia lemnae TaxID=5949 RepID=A0A078ATF8_STYLE|nr:UNKNOWN [Stylonychia lemnae]|eukprot:CDW85509.1 UNKNOWN [Stylonychia lemnae]
MRITIKSNQNHRKKDNAPLVNIVFLKDYSALAAISKIINNHYPRYNKPLKRSRIIIQSVLLNQTTNQEELL